MKNFFIVITILFSLMSLNAFAAADTGLDPILRPILRMNGGKLVPCLTRLVMRSLTPGQEIVEWQGPGMKASPAGEVDKSIALYIAKVSNPEQHFALVFVSQNENGWSVFGYHEGEILRVGMRAKEMDRIGYWLEVKPRQSLSEQIRLQDADEVDLSACEKDFQEKL